MKGNKLFLTLLLPLGFAVGCNEQTPSLPALTQTHLDDLGKGFSFETLQTSKTIPHDNNGEVETSKQIIETEAIKDKLTFIAHAPVKVGEPNKDDTLLAETWVGKTEGGKKYVYQTRLGISNTTNYYKVQNPATGEYFEFDKDGYGNPFRFLKVKNFELKNNKYELEMGNSSLEGIYQSFSNNIYGGPGLTLTSLNLTVNETQVTDIYSTFEFKGAGADYEYTFETKVNKVAPLQIRERAVPYEEVEDKLFDDAIALLKGHNYVLDQADQVMGPQGAEQISLINMKASKDSFSFRNEELSEETGTHELVHAEAGLHTADGYKSLLPGETEDTYIDNGELAEEFFNALFPEFNISRACFDYNEAEDIYVLKEDVEGDIYAYTPFEGKAELYQKLGIRIAKDLSTIDFIATRGSVATLTSFSEFGKVKTITEDQISKPQNVSWQTLLNDETAYTKLTTNVGAVMDKIPLVEGLTQQGSWVDFADTEPTYSLLVYSGDTEPTQAHADAYNAALIANGWVDMEEDAFGLGLGSTYALETTDGSTYLAQCVYGDLGDLVSVAIVFANMADFA